MAACARAYPLFATHIAGAIFGGIGGAGAAKKEGYGRSYCYRAEHDFLHVCIIETPRCQTTQVRCGSVTGGAGAGLDFQTLNIANELLESYAG